MSSAKLLTSTPAPPSVAALVYAGLLLVLIAATTLPIKSVLDQWDEVAALTGTLRLLDAHSMVPAHQDGEEVIRKGSAFLEGPTVTVAGAVLLQRLGDVVTRHSGSMSSSQLDVQGPRANDGHISVTANFEVAEVALQSVLYELEAGMPYLFVDELVVEGNSSLATSGGKLRVTITVSGQWQGPQ